MIKRNIYLVLFTSALIAMLMFSSCASKKKTLSGTDENIVENASMLKHKKEVFDKVYCNTLTSNALTSKMKFTVQAGEKSISVAGQLEMKNDAYIRIRLTPLGLLEVGMIEFTPDYVLILDRMHKEYIKAEYLQVPFLQANGVDFYALQSLFRNMLFVPGEKHIAAESYRQFDVNKSGNNIIFSAHKGNTDYSWITESATGKINKAEFTYISNGSTSKLNCSYSDFINVSGKMFPHKLLLNFHTNMTKDFGNLMLMVSAKKFRTEQKGDGRPTQIPRRYAEKDVNEMLNNLLEVK